AGPGYQAGRRELGAGEALPAGDDGGEGDRRSDGEIACIRRAPAGEELPILVPGAQDRERGEAGEEDGAHQTRREQHVRRRQERDADEEGVARHALDAARSADGRIDVITRCPTASRSSPT